ncbi:response regulator [Leptospira langatensis]|uniref:Response regulator n=1 Tax=Leptospira langatensis TaxID=2484983 RepID=A0A5F1ZVA2_9LEPT|nr:response regulator [Leptospira langatensis]TGK01165.1 response regulator [Leptospira langatensis]TGL42383.1 response regulator [Leptospira langatensis]
METKTRQEAILCVDDEAIILITLQKELKKQMGDEYLYETAMSGNEALEIIDDLVSAGVSVILILSDWLMPGLKGDEFLVLVHQKYPNIRSILVTGHVDAEAADRVKREAGTYAVIPKPWDVKKLMDAVRVCCGK